MADSLLNAATASDDVATLHVEVLSWGLGKSELRSILRERDDDLADQTAATRGFRSNDRIFSLAYEIANKSGDGLTVFGGGTIGLGDLPMVVGNEAGEVRLLMTTDLDPNVTFVRQPHIGGHRLEPGETLRAILSISYPLQDQWRRQRRYEPDAVDFCVGLTTDHSQGVTASYLGEAGSALYWPMGKPSPIELCQTVRR